MKKGMKYRTFVLAILLCIPLTSWAEVTLRIAWDLNEPFSELQALVKEGTALQKKINPKVKHELWLDIVHGTGGGSASLLVYYEDFEHYARAITRESASKAWNKFISSFPENKFPTTFVGLSRTLVGGDLSETTGGETLAIIAFDANESVADFTELVSEAVRIQKQINPKASIKLSASQIAGESVGGLAVLIRYPSMLDWAQGVAKLEASEDWREFLENFPADKYPVVYQGLSQAGDIN